MALIVMCRQVMFEVMLALSCVICSCAMKERGMRCFELMALDKLGAVSSTLFVYTTSTVSYLNNTPGKCVGVKCIKLCCDFSVLS